MSSTLQTYRGLPAAASVAEAIRLAQIEILRMYENQNRQ
jgi:hypothetical protein